MSTYQVTITGTDGDVSEGTYTEAQALSLLLRSVGHGCTVEATRHGGALIVRKVATGLSIVPARRTITIEPATQVKTLTDMMRSDLQAIAARTGKYPARMMHGRINAGLCSIPPAAVARLMARGLVDVTEAAVTVTIAGRLAMLAQDHHTTTREPRGYRWAGDIRPGSVGLNKGGGRGGKLYDRSSGASCSCHGWSIPTEDRESARRKAREHREQVTAALVAELVAS